jgi:uncharacterized phiE125 gp8 family phage protein
MPVYSNATQVLALPATEQIVTLSEAKEHLRVTYIDEDQYIIQLISVAESVIQNWTNRKLTIQTLQSWYPCFGSALILPYSPVISVTDIIYYPESGSSQTLAPSDYQAEIIVEPHRIIPALNKTWPTITLRRIQPIEVRYIAGYTITPTAIKHAMLLMIATYYQDRENVNRSNLIPRALLHGSERLVDEYVYRQQR